MAASKVSGTAVEVVTVVAEPEPVSRIDGLIVPELGSNIAAGEGHALPAGQRGLADRGAPQRHRLGQHAVSHPPSPGLA